MTNKIHHQVHISSNPLEDTLRDGAKKLLQAVLKNEINEWIEIFNQKKDERGRRTVIRNGYLPEYCIQAGMGHILVK